MFRECALRHRAACLCAADFCGDSGGAALGIIMAAAQYRAEHVSLAGCLLIILLSADFFIPMRQITYVSHQSYLFKGTVRGNLRMGKPDAEDNELWAVLERVNLAAFLKEEQGLDTSISEKGGNLSGGQCQRLALAKAFLHDSPVYIFDEATSNIDAESENDIMGEIRRLAKTKTVILISHRLANVTASDRMQLIGLVRSLAGYMLLVILMGLIGHLCACFITIFGGYAVLELLGFETYLALTAVFVCAVAFAVLRAGLRYGEQTCNHFIAFKLLAMIRDKVFRALRRLSPAKLEGRDKGDLISVITSDIELLEVFYATPFLLPPLHSCLR